MLKPVQKYNAKTYQYEDYELPAGAVMRAELDDVVCCAACGTGMQYKHSMVSLLIHNANGFGYAVCRECGRKELEYLHNVNYKGDV